MPGEDVAQHPELGALNNTNDDPNEIAAKHEATVAAKHAADLMQKGNTDEAMRVLAEAQARVAAATAEKAAPDRGVMVDDLDLSVFGDDGEIERVAVPPVRRSPDVDKYGPELKFPNGTQLNANRQPCEGDEEPVYYVGNLHLKNRGILCNRAIPYKRATAAPAPSQEAAA